MAWIPLNAFGGNAGDVMQPCGDLCLVYALKGAKPSGIFATMVIENDVTPFDVDAFVSTGLNEKSPTMFAVDTKRAVAQIEGDQRVFAIFDGLAGGLGEVFDGQIPR